jgi:predicted dehydrogenase
VPPGLHYDLWLGPIPPVPYHPEYLPFKWRNWWAFGGGGLADFGCHYMDLPHWALDLRGPLTVESEGPEVSPVSPPLWQIVRYEYPARGEQPPVKLTWYHGGKHPEQAEPLLKDFASGVLFVGEKGQLVSDYGKHKLLPEKDFEGFKRPEPFIAKSIGHHREWIEAIKSNGKTTCNFDYSGALTEAVLLGNAAYRSGKKLEWDDAAMKVKNTADADKFIQHEYREGWSL